MTTRILERVKEWQKESCTEAPSTGQIDTASEASPEATARPKVADIGVVHEETSNVVPPPAPLAESQSVLPESSDEEEEKQEQHGTGDRQDSVDSREERLRSHEGPRSSRYGKRDRHDGEMRHRNGEDGRPRGHRNEHSASTSPATNPHRYPSDRNHRRISASHARGTPPPPYSASVAPLSPALQQHHHLPPPAVLTPVASPPMQPQMLPSSSPHAQVLYYVQGPNGAPQPVFAAPPPPTNLPASLAAALGQEMAYAAHPQYGIQHPQGVPMGYVPGYGYAPQSMPPQMQQYAPMAPQYAPQGQAHVTAYMQQPPMYAAPLTRSLPIPNTPPPATTQASVQAPVGSAERHQALMRLVPGDVRIKCLHVALAFAPSEPVPMDKEFPPNSVLERFFGQFGEVVSIELINERNSSQTRYAFLEMGTREQAIAAFMTTGVYTNVEGTNLKIGWSKDFRDVGQPRQHRPVGGRDGDRFDRPTRGDRNSRPRI